MRATDGLSRVLLSREGVRDWPVRQALAASIAFALLLGAFLAARRFSGALDMVPPPLQLATTSLLLLGWAVVVRAIVPGKLSAWLTAAVLLLFATAFSFPGERAVDWLVWLAVFGVFLVSHSVIADVPRKRSMPATETDRVLQQLTRSRSATGQAVIQGTLLAEFAPGERSAMLYVAFCPPFERLPQIELESSADARLVQTLHHGAQIEVRLPSAAKSATTASVEMYATDAE